MTAKTYRSRNGTLVKAIQIGPYGRALEDVAYAFPKCSIRLYYGGAYAVLNSQDWVRCETGDWIVEHPDGEYTPITRSRFAYQYEQISEGA